MRKVYLDMTSSSNGWDDTYYYLVFDEEAAELYIERSWHNMSPKGIVQGSENITLAELKRKRRNIYQKVVDIITTSFPHEKDEDILTYPLADNLRK
ncbi:MAG: hypothetical protein ABWZ66_00680 [Pyrinomonadaceae bacterium]